MTEQNALGARIARMIAAQGPISVAQFMTIALHDRQSGYYARRDPLGTDFITAPEMTQAFGELLGLWCAQVWEDQGKPTPARLVELGPGRGTLMADALRAARLMPDFLAAIEVVLVEAKDHSEVLVEDVVVSDAEGGSEEIVVVEELDETPVTEEEA